MVMHLSSIGSKGHDMDWETVRMKAADVQAEGRKQVQINGSTIVVFAFNNGFVAYHDVCPHQGGPVCSKGSLFPDYTARIAEDGRVTPYFEEGGEKVLACPWHGWEFYLESGRCLADKSKQLRAAKVAQEGDELVISP